MKQKVIVIAGPTAVGKTKFAIEIAEWAGGEIVSCDSMQLYQYLDIGSAKPTAEEQARVRHHLVDLIDPREPFSVAEYQKLAKEAIQDVLRRGKTPVVSGGTGLYLNALLYDMDFSVEAADQDYRRELEALAEEEGTAAVHRLLEEKDPKAAELIHPNNLKRTIRALERIRHGEATVRPFREIETENEEYDWILVGLTRDRAELYDRINQRVDLLMDAGLLEEVGKLRSMGLTSSDISMKGIGYKEILGYLDEAYSLDEAIDLVKKNTRHYAKKQLTWFRRYDKMYWLNISDYKTEEEAIEVLKAWLIKRL